MTEGPPLSISLCRMPSHTALFTVKVAEDVTLYTFALLSFLLYTSTVSTCSLICTTSQYTFTLIIGRQETLRGETVISECYLASQPKDA